jgi:hypothetical protein
MGAFGKDEDKLKPDIEKSQYRLRQRAGKIDCSRW